MSKITGKISVFGVAGDVVLTATGIIAPANMVTQGLSFRQNTKKADLLDGDGEVVSRVHYGPEHSITFVFCVKDNTVPGNAVNLKASIKVPDSGSKANISNSTLPIFDGDWEFGGDMSIDPPQGGFLKCTCTLMRSGKPSSGLTPTYLTDAP